MAKILNGFLGDAINKLGNVVLLRSKNGAIVRSYQPKVFNPKTPGQQSNRNKLKNLSQFLSLINPTFIKFLYGISGINKNQFARAIRDNQNLIDQSGNINLECLKLGITNFPAPSVLSCTYDAFVDNLKIKIDHNSIPKLNDFETYTFSVLFQNANNTGPFNNWNTNHVEYESLYFEFYCNYTEIVNYGENGIDLLTFQQTNACYKGHFYLKSRILLSRENIW